MKISLLILVLALVCSTLALTSPLCRSSSGTVCNGNVVVNTAAQLNTLSGFTSIVGSLTIQLNQTTGALNLDRLTSLRSISGVLNIQNSLRLTSISGLVNLNAVAGITINNNPALTVVAGAFANLRSISGSIVISNNAALVNISSFAGLTRVGLDLTLLNNIRLTTAPFSALVSIGRNLVITNNGLITINGFPLLQAVAGVLINANAQLTTISSFANIQAITRDFFLTNVVLRITSGSFIVSNNTNLQVFVGLTKTRTLGGTVQIEATTDLTSVSALVSLQTIVGNVEINNNQALVELTLFSTVRTLTGFIDIFNNPLLADVTILRALTAINGDLIITDLTNVVRTAGSIILRRNADLTNFLSSFLNLRTIGGDLEILTSSVTSFVFSTLQTVTGNIVVSNNNGLVRLSLDNIVTIDGNLVLLNNSALTTIPSFLKTLDVGGLIQILNNPLLVNLNIFANLPEIQAPVTISGNVGLRSLNAFVRVAALDTDVSVQITNNVNLQTLNILVNVQDIVGNVTVSGVALSRTLNLVGSVVIAANPLLQTLSSTLANVETIGGSLIFNANLNLLTIPALADLVTIDGDLSITANARITVLNGLVSVTVVNGDITISANPLLANILNFLNSLTSVVDLSILNNPLLRTVTGLVDLEQILGNLVISANANLTTVLNLDDISINGDISILNNIRLANLDLSLENLGGDIAINGNAIVDLTGLCSLLSSGGLVSITQGTCVNVGSLLNLRACACSIDNVEIQANTAVAVNGALNLVLSGVNVNAILGNISAVNVAAGARVSVADVDVQLSGAALSNLNAGVIISPLVEITLSQGLTVDLSLLAQVTLLPIQLVQLNADASAFVPVGGLQLLSFLGSTNVNIFSTVSSLLNSVEISASGIYAVRIAL